jgi:hypothetical protein
MRGHEYIIRDMGQGIRETGEEFQDGSAGLWFRFNVTSRKWLQLFKID